MFGGRWSNVAFWLFKDMLRGAAMGLLCLRYRELAELNPKRGHEMSGWAPKADVLGALDP